MEGARDVEHFLSFQFHSLSERKTDEQKKETSMEDERRRWTILTISSCEPSVSLMDSFLSKYLLFTIHFSSLSQTGLRMPKQWKGFCGLTFDGDSRFLRFMDLTIKPKRQCPRHTAEQERL